MKGDPNISQSVYRLAKEGIADVELRATKCITHARGSVERANQPEVMVLQARRDFLLERRGILLEEILAHWRRASQHHGARWGAWNLSIAMILIIGAFVFAVKTIEPFGLGWMGWVYCAALTVALPFALDRFLLDFRHPAVKRIVVCAALASSLATAILFGMLRGDVLAYSLNSVPAVVVDNLEAPAPSTHTSDTELLVRSLRLVWGLAALAFELAAALAIHEFREGRRKFDFGALRRAQKELVKVEKELLVVMQRLRQLLSQPGDLEAGCWANFERGLYDGRSRHTALRRLASWALGVLMTVSAIQAADRLHIITALDLSKTEQTHNYSGKAEFDENVRAVSSILANIPAACQMTIIGITDRSYVNPLVLLAARTSPDPGPFSNRLTAGRRNLISEWSKRSKALNPSWNETDLLGALRYAGEVLARSEANRKALVILSDGRNYTAELDLETRKAVAVEKSLKQVEEQKLFADLSGVEVFLFGGGDHSAKRGIAYTVGLKAFWTRFVERSGGTLRVFSTTRDAEDLRAVTTLPAAKGGLP